MPPVSTRKHVHGSVKRKEKKKRDEFIKSQANSMLKFVTKSGPSKTDVPTEDEINKKDACDEEEMLTNENQENADAVEYMEETREKNMEETREKNIRNVNASMETWILLILEHGKELRKGIEISWLKRVLRSDYQLIITFRETNLIDVFLIHLIQEK